MGTSPGHLSSIAQLVTELYYEKRRRENDQRGIEDILAAQNTDKFVYDIYNPAYGHLVPGTHSKDPDDKQYFSMGPNERIYNYRSSTPRADLESNSHKRNTDPVNQ